MPDLCHHAVTPELLGILLEEHGAALRLYARQWCSSPDDALQDALLRLARERRAPDRLLPWLYRVVRNRAISLSRSARRRARYETAAGTDAEPWFQPAAGLELDGQAAAAELAALPLAQREVLVARLWGNLRFEEIGELTGTSSSTAHRRYLDGLRILRERLGVSC